MGFVSADLGGVVSEYSPLESIVALVVTGIFSLHFTFFALGLFSMASSLRGFLVSEIGPVDFFFRPIYFLVA